MLENNKVIVSINGEKIEQPIDSLTLNMPSEAAALLSLMQSQTPISKVSGTSFDLKNVIENEPISSALIRREPDIMATLVKHKTYAEKVKNETDPLKRMIIDETGIALGLIVGVTKKSKVVEIMKNYSNSVPGEDEAFFFYNDLTISIFFDNDSEVISEMQFGNLYKGKTLKGLLIGDTVEQAIEIYGQPKLKSPRGAIWNKFAIFCEKNIITSIRIQK